jgi:hypothetical protein
MRPGASDPFQGQYDSQGLPNVALGGQDAGCTGASLLEREPESVNWPGDDAVKVVPGTREQVFLCGVSQTENARRN